MPHPLENGGRQLEGDAGAGQVAERRVAGFDLRVDHRERRRKLGVRKMVIGDDHVESEAGRLRSAVESGDAAVHGDQEGTTRFVRAAGVYRLEAVALLVAHRKDRQGLQTDRAERGGEQGRRSDAVRIVVADHRDLLSRTRRRSQAIGRERHAAEGRRRPDLVERRIQEPTGSTRLGEPAPGQQAGEWSFDAAPDEIRHRLGGWLDPLPNRRRTIHSGFVEDAELAEPPVALVQEALDRLLAEILEDLRELVAQPPSASARIGVGTAQGLRHDLIDDPESQQVGRRQPHRFGGLGFPLLVFPEDRRATLGRDHRVDGILENEDTISDPQSERTAAPPRR